MGIPWNKAIIPGPRPTITPSGDTSDESTSAMTLSTSSKRSNYKKRTPMTTGVFSNYRGNGTTTILTMNDGSIRENNVTKFTSNPSKNNTTIVTLREF